MQHGLLHNGKHRLYGRGRGLFLLGCALGFLPVSALAQGNWWTQSAVESIVDDAGLISGDTDSIREHVIDIDQKLGFIESGLQGVWGLQDYWTNRVVWGRPSSGGRVTGIRRDLYDWLSGVPMLTNVFHTSTDRVWVENPVGSYAFLAFYDEVFPKEQFYTYDFPEFLSLALGQNVDSRGFAEFEHSLNNGSGMIVPATSLDEAWELAFNPWKIGGEYLGEVGFYSVWEAEAWRRQLGALGFMTNSWSSFTNSAFIGYSGVFDGAPASLNYITNETIASFLSTNGLPEGATNEAHGFSTEIDLTKMSRGLIGTNSDEVAQSSGLNRVVGMVSNKAYTVDILDKLLPEANTGGLNFEARFDGLSAAGSSGKRGLLKAVSQLDRFEIDLNGTEFERALQDVKKLIRVLVLFVFYVFQIWCIVRTVCYVMDATGSGA